MAYFPQSQTKDEITASAQLKNSAGHILKLIVHIKGKSGVWRVWDAIGRRGVSSLETGSIVWAAQFDNPRVQEACIVDLDWPCSTGIYLEVPTGGVCSALWI
jgi:hypothetical protein